MPFGSMYSCSCAPVSYSPSTISAASAQAASTSPRDTVYDLNTLSLPQTTRSRGERAVDREHAGLRRHPHVNVPARLLDQEAIAMREERDRLFGMVDRFAREVGLVVDDQRDAVAAGHIRGGDDGELVPRNAGSEVDAEDAAARDLAAHGRPVEHAGQREVVDVPRPASDLGLAFATRQGSTDERSFHSRRSYSRSPGGGNLRRGYLNVLQAFGSPESRPRRNQVTRCSDDPCVKRSGATWPVCMR